MPSGSGARASASSSAAERSSYRATVMCYSSSCRSAPPDAAVEQPLRIVRRADVLIEVEEVRDGQHAPVRRGEQLGVVQAVEGEVEIADQVLEHVGEGQLLLFEIRWSRALDLDDFREIAVRQLVRVLDDDRVALCFLL